MALLVPASFACETFLVQIFELTYVGKRKVITGSLKTNSLNLPLMWYFNEREANLIQHTYIVLKMDHMLPKL